MSNHDHKDIGCSCMDGTIYKPVQVIDEIDLDIESLKLLKEIASTMLKNKPIREEYLNYTQELMNRLNLSLQKLREGL